MLFREAEQRRDQATEQIMNDGYKYRNTALFATDLTFKVGNNQVPDINNECKLCGHVFPTIFNFS